MPILREGLWTDRGNIVIVLCDVGSSRSVCGDGEGREDERLRNEEGLGTLLQYGGEVRGKGK